MPKEFVCYTCEKPFPKEEMRKSAKGRTTRHCKSCKGFCRCLKCNEVKNIKEFKKSSKARGFLFEDGEDMPIRICWTCDAQIHKPTRNRYLRKRLSENSIKAFVATNFRRWRTKTDDTFDLTQNYLIELWNQQSGMCYYSGKPLTLKRGIGEWDGPSLDKKVPGLGYVKGNVVWTSRMLNTCKSRLTKDAFFKMCLEVAEYAKSQRIT